MRTYAAEQLSVAGTAVGFTANTYGAIAGMGHQVRAICHVEGAAIRYRNNADGTAVTATTGMRFEPGDFFWISGAEDLANARFIREGGVSGTLNVEYVRP